MSLVGKGESYVLKLDALGQRVTDLERSHCDVYVKLKL